MGEHRLEILYVVKFMKQCAVTDKSLIVSCFTNSHIPFLLDCGLVLGTRDWTSGRWLCCSSERMALGTLGDSLANSAVAFVVEFRITGNVC